MNHSKNWKSLCCNMLKTILLHELYDMSKTNFRMYVAFDSATDFMVSITHAGTKVSVLYEMPLLNVKKLQRFIRWTVSERPIRQAMAVRILEMWNLKDEKNKKAKYHLN